MQFFPQENLLRRSSWEECCAFFRSLEKFSIMGETAKHHKSIKFMTFLSAPRGTLLLFYHKIGNLPPVFVVIVQEKIEQAPIIQENLLFGARFAYGINPSKIKTSNAYFISSSSSLLLTVHATAGLQYSFLQILLPGSSLNRWL